MASFCIYAQVHRVIATKIRRKSLPVTQRNVKNIPNLFSFLSPSCFLFGTSFYNLERKRKKHDQKNCVIRKKKTRSEYCEYLWESSEQVHRKGKRFLSNLTFGKRHREKRYSVYMFLYWQRIKVMVNSRIMLHVCFFFFFSFIFPFSQY